MRWRLKVRELVVRMLGGDADLRDSMTTDVGVPDPHAATPPPHCYLPLAFTFNHHSSVYGHMLR